MDFDQILNSDPVIAARWDECTTKLVALGRQALDVDLTETDLRGCPEARIAAVSGQAMNMDRALEELQALDRTKGLLEEQRRAAAIRGGDAGELDKLSRMPRAERMAEARKLGLDDLNPTRPASSIDSPEVLLRRAMSLSPARRIAFCREHGLIK